MKRKNTLSKILITFVTFSVGTSLAIHVNTKPNRVDATPYVGNFASYTYSGSYYDSIDFNSGYGMNGTLRTSLTSLIKPAGFYTYSSDGETHLATQLQYADEDPTNSSNMIYLYTRDSVKKNSADSWNREHCWPQSLSNGNWGTSEGGTDILHLRPTYPNTNSSRGNTPYGNSGHATRKVFNNMDYGYTGNGYFEPLDEVKGDVARIIMYVWTTYTGWSGYSSLNILKVFESYDTLLQWHIDDKPDAIEGNRNDYCQTSRQKNRNPFVDHPELAWKIFGDNASASIKSACMTAYPGSSSSSSNPVTPTGISLNKTTASVSVGKTLQLSASLQPSGATGTVSWSSNNSSVASVNSTGLVTANAAGSATITASINGLTANCVITVTESANNYGTLENPLSITDAKEIIDINGTTMSSQPLYVKGIVSSNSSYNTTYKNYDYIWLQSEDGKTSQAFELYRTKLNSSITGSYGSANSLVGKEVVAYGYGKIYGSTYELCQSTGYTPAYAEILSLNDPEATDIALNKSSVEINAGDSTTLIATLTPSNSSSTVTWESSDESVATVTNGVVRGISAGTATIFATVSDDIEAQCLVTVIGSSTVSSDELTIDLSKNNTATATEQEISWIDSNIYSIGCVQGPGGTAANNYYGGDSQGRTSTRFYKNSTLTITPASGVDITNVEFNATTEGYATTLQTSTWTNASASASSKKVTVTPIDGTSAFSAVIGGTCGFTSIKISYEIHSSTGNSPTAYLNNASSFAAIYGTESTSEQYKTGSVTFSTLNLNNAEQYSDPFNIDNGAATVTFSGGGNNGKYYTTGSAIRIYGDGTITVSSSYTITNIDFTWSSGDEYMPESNDVTNVGSYNHSTGIWTGESNSIILTRPTGSGHWRLQKVSVIYLGEATSVSSVALRFGAKFEKDVWDDMAEEFAIKDYGVMLFKRLENSAIPSLTVKQAYEDGKTLAIVRKGSGAAPYLDTDSNEYIFNAKVNISSSNYELVIVAAPFVVIEDSEGNEQYYFLEQLEYSAKTLAQHYLGDGSYEYLSQDALGVLANS